MDPRTPCLIGVAQQTWREPGEHPAPEPLDMWVQVCRSAAEDAGGSAALERVDDLQVVYCQSWSYDDPALRLGARLGIEPSRAVYSGIGGTTGQVLVDSAASAIRRGESEVALITGAEALATLRRLAKEGTGPRWSHPHPGRPGMPFEAPFHPAEVAHEVFRATLTFSVFDIARRSRLGVAPDAYIHQLAELASPMTEVAAANDLAWFRVRRDPEEIATPTAVNRMVNLPYTKYMVAMMDVDMAAALLLASEEAADSLAVPRDRRVYLRGSASAFDPVYLAEHPDLSRSPAMAAAGHQALQGAGIGIDDVAHLDLYSCFPSALNLASDALSIKPGDGRQLTVTGGLANFGGPASNYVTHSIAQMADVLRADPGSFGLVSGIGMHMTKHAYGLYSTTPPDRLDGRAEMGGAPGAAHDPPSTVPIAEGHDGPARLATYGVTYGRSDPEWMLAICDLPDGRRCYARSEDPAILGSAVEEDLVGRPVTVRAGEGGRNAVQL